MRQWIVLPIALYSALTFAAPTLEKVLNIDKGTQKDWNEMADDGGWEPIDRWQGISPKNISISHNKETKAIISYEIVYKVSGNSVASSPKKIRQILNKYCGIGPDTWEGSNVNEQRGEGSRCLAEYTFDGETGHIMVTHK